MEFQSWFAILLKKQKMNTASMIVMRFAEFQNQKMIAKAENL